MRRPKALTCAAVALSGLLTACAAGNTGAKFSVSHIALPAVNVAPPVPIVLPPPCPADLRAPLMAEPQLPDDAFFPAPETSEAAAHVASYLTFLHAYAAWGRQGWSKALDAKMFCEK